MNITVQSCGIAILLVLLYFYVKQRMINLRTGAVFLVALAVTLFSVIFDILSLVALEYRAVIPEMLLRVICKMYLVSLVAVGFMGLLYICTDIFKSQKSFQRIIYYSVVAMVLFAVLILLVPIHYVVENDMVMYTEGPAVLATYAGAVGFLVINLIMMVVYRKRIQPARFQAAITWVAVWIIAALTQFMDNSLLLVGFASCIGLMIVYIKLENPDNYRDANSGMLNQMALSSFMNQCYADGDKKSILFLQWDDSESYNLDRETMGRYRKENLQMLSSIKGSHVFRYTEEDVAMVFQQPEEAEQIIKAIQDKVAEMNVKIEKYRCSYELIYFADCQIVPDFNALLKTRSYVRKWQQNLGNQKLIRVNKALVEGMQRERKKEQWIDVAIENEERVEVFFQPIYSVKDKRFSSAEALVRLRDDDGKLIYPNEFIEVAEKNGGILSLGKIVFEHVCRFIQKYKGKFPDIEYIEVNLSVVQCAYEHLADDFIGIMKKYQVDPSWINLEITESAILTNRKNLLKNMRKLRDFGVSFSLDDFGTGASNLNYIVEMPVDIVKFDRVMTNAYFDNQKAKYVMEAAMLMIRGLELKIVAEGIEEEEQFRIMEQLEIDFIQGYYFSKPLPEDKFYEFLEADLK